MKIVTLERMVPPGASTPLRVINSIAPIRICDLGGWTDTWFAGHGKVCSLAVAPCVDVQMKVYPRTANRERITIHVENYGERYARVERTGLYDKHPLIEAAMEHIAVPRDLAVEVSIYSDTPPGCSTGTSAALSVALLGALDCLTPGRMSPYEVAAAAFRVETELLHQQCGIQDQLAAAYGGINCIDMWKYPHATVQAISIPDALWWELEHRLVLIYIGRSHSSSEVHRMVIRRLEASGMDSPQLAVLRRCAERARDALAGGSLEHFGAAMIENTEAQASLHPELVGAHHREVIGIARAFDATGWKVNGAGGDGGSVTILSQPDSPRRREMIRAILAANPQYRHIPTHLARHGLRIWESAGSRVAAAEVSSCDAHTC